MCCSIFFPIFTKKETSRGNDINFNRIKDSVLQLSKLNNFFFKELITQSKTNFFGKNGVIYLKDDVKKSRYQRAVPPLPLLIFLQSLRRIGQI